MNAVKLFARDSGSGNAVVLAHAIGFDHRMWEEVSPALEPDHRVIAVDLRGHGTSPVPPAPYSLEEMALDCVAVLDRLGIERADFVGLSLGGMVGQAFALRHPQRLSRLVLANTTSSYGAAGPALWEGRKKAIREGGLAAIRDAVASRGFSEAFRAREPGKVAGFMSRFLASPVEGYLGSCDAILGLEYAESLAQVRAPTLVLAGELDQGAPVAMHEAIATRIPGARLEINPGVAHLSAMERPAQFAAFLRGFLK
jgi:3-oxoadipate enol-lactonase